MVSTGFACQGNEFSHYMLLTSYLILNRTQSIDEHTIYPYIHSFSNVLSHETLLKAVTVPDVLPSDLPPGSNFSLVAGDFKEIYSAENMDENEPQAGKWDTILTCFFIDTAKNVVNYLRILHHILAPGRVWINLGPLLWHFENNENECPSIELDLAEVKELACTIGFELYDERTIHTSYSSNDQSMLRYIYHATFWKAAKVSPVE
ncbi:N2227-like protein [Pisolithus marmoratus]|nr:N2227-like protein [Pisolithus marmoratus]